MNAIDAQLLAEFKISGDTLRIYRDGKCLFKSDGETLRPLLEYISHFDIRKPVTMLDRVSGNAAALLAVKAGVKRIYAPLGSELASRTLHRHQIDHYFERTVPYICGRNNKGICPMERLSLNKEPEEFYKALREKSKPGNKRI